MENHKSKLKTNGMRWDKGVCPLGVRARVSPRAGRSELGLALRAQRVRRSGSSRQGPSSRWMFNVFPLRDKHCAQHCTE